MSVRSAAYFLIAGLLAAPAAGVAQESAEEALLGSQIAEVEAAIAKYRDVGAARRDGWRRATRDVPLMGEHWNRRRGPDYRSGDAIDFAQPSNLMYTKIEGETVLTGVAYVVRIAEGEPLPDGFAGSQDRWHVHNARQLIDEGFDNRPLVRWFATRVVNNRFDDEDGVMRSRVWVTLPNPDGPFADFNRLLPYRKLGLPLGHADGASLDAARGLNLATENGCANALDGPLWLANVTRQQRRTLKDACADWAEAVRSNLDQPPATLNAVAEDAWRFLDGLIGSVCSPEQLRRIASIKEGDD